jgi:hypothetical protein
MEIRPMKILLAHDGLQEREKSPIHEAYAEGQSIGAKVKLGTDWRNHWIHRNHWIYKGFGQI